MRRTLYALALLICLSTSATADQPRDTTALSQRLFQTFLTLYQQDPAALTRFAGALRHITPQQLDDTMAFLGVTHFSYLFPMVINGRDIASLKGTDNQRLSLMAARGPHHRMIPIPYQIDEFDRAGLIWIKGYNTHPAAGTPGQWDAFDQLAFMYRDAGQHRYNPTTDGQVAGHILKEIKLTFPGSQPRWVYLVKDNPQRSDADYTSTDLKKGRVSSTLYDFNYDPRDLVKIHSIVPRSGPLFGQNIFAGLSLHINSGVFSRYLRVGLSNNNFRVTPIAVKDGPVRNIMLVKARIWYFGLPTFLNQRLMLYFYEQAISLPARIAPDSLNSLSFLVGLLRGPKASISLHLQHLDGAGFDIQNRPAPHRPVIIDGHMSAAEKRLNHIRLPGDWLQIDSHQGWQMFIANHLPVTPHGLINRLLDDANMHLVYNDQRPYADTGKPSPIVTLGLAGDGMPQLLVALANIIDQLDMGPDDTLGDMLIALAKKPQMQALDAFDKQLNARLKRLQTNGFVASPAQLALRLLADIDRLQFVGIDKSTLEQLIHDALLKSVMQVDAIDTQHVLQTLISLAQQRHIDLANLRYAVMNTTLWMPDQLGDNGPAGFNRQLQQPPRFEVRAFSSQEEAPKASPRITPVTKASQTPKKPRTPP